MNRGDLYGKSYNRLYETEVYENDVLIANYIPCYRKADNVTGVYDLIGGNFYTNNGTGDFIIKKEEDGYQEIEYIQGDEGKQYIDTGLVLGEKFTIKTAFAQTKKIGYEQPVISTWSGSYFNVFVRSNEQKLDLYTSGHHIANTELKTYEKNNVTISRDNSNWTWILNDETINFTYTAAANTTTLKLLNRGDLNGTSYNRLYKTEVYENDVLIANYIPCYRKADKRIGVFDTINEKFYYDGRGGTFLAGPEI